MSGAKVPRWKTYPRLLPKASAFFEVGREDLFTNAQMIEKHNTLATRVESLEAQVAELEQERKDDGSTIDMLKARVAALKELAKALTAAYALQVSNSADLKPSPDALERACAAEFAKCREVGAIE